MNFIIKMGVYDSFPIMVSLGESDKELSKNLLKWKVPKEEISKPSLRDADGIYYMFSNYKSIIRLPKIPRSPYQLGVMVHEINHCTVGILRMAGIKLSPKSEEAYSYLSQFITYRILKKCAS